jgi:hypothetical protein
MRHRGARGKAPRALEAAPRSRRALGCERQPNPGQTTPAAIGMRPLARPVAIAGKSVELPSILALAPRERSVLMDAICA